jgi:hypothetical protein
LQTHPLTIDEKRRVQQEKHEWEAALGTSKIGFPGTSGQCMMTKAEVKALEATFKLTDRIKTNMIMQQMFVIRRLHNMVEDNLDMTRWQNRE